MKYEIVENKDWVKGAGCYPARIVLLKIKKADGRHEWSTHMEVNPTPDQKSNYMVQGHYFCDIFDAVNDFKNRKV